MNNCEVWFVGIDSWNRPIFKDELNNYYGSTNKLFPYPASEHDVMKIVTPEDLTYFGSKFDCEPMGTPVSNITIIKKEG